MKLTKKESLYKLQEIASILRGENGCAWDRKQTPDSLKPYLIEEAYEVYDAIEIGTPDDLKEELGDLLFQIYIHSQIASEQNLFTIDDVADSITEKLIRRHPHVFGGTKVETVDEVLENWEIIKKKEKPHRSSMLEGVPKHLPALLKAYRIQQKVSRVGFDWDNIDDVIGKIEEEVNELKEIIHSDNREEIIEEAGDILFSIANLLRFVKINPEEALKKTNTKFIKRFKSIEKMATEKGKNLEDMDLEEMEILWEKSKSL